MVDIETLSTQADACVISIGFAEFDDSGVTETCGLAIRDSDWTGHIDPRTVKWWMKQDEVAREYSFNGTASAMEAAAMMQQVLQDADEVWANSPQFDLTILRQWWKRMHKGNFPVHFRAERDCRTIFNESRRMGIELGNAWLGTSVAHNPIDDAANQARAIVEWRKKTL
jgi:hypothetical protein